jgi:uncharacterized protein (DUF2141 family)
MNTPRRLFAIAIFFSLLGYGVMVAAQSNTSAPAPSAATKPTYTLTVHVEGVNQDDGNIGVLVFQNDKGWPEDRLVALRDEVVPAHPGTVTVTISNLPAGDYAVSVAHDVNKNRKLDKNFIGKPKEQWGLSNNPHAVIKAPAFTKCKFSLTKDTELHVTMQM